MMFRNPEIFRYPSAIPLEPRGIVDEVVIVPNLIKLDQYNRLGDYLVEDLGYERGKDFFEFAYDWQQDVRTSAQQLGKFVESLPFSIMGEKLRQTILTFPSSYQIIPTYSCVADQSGEKINFLEDESWLPEAYRPLLRAGRQFRKELSKHSSVPAISIYRFMGMGSKRLLAVF